MPFPESEKVYYKDNPLAEVICQLRFPPILSIESELPARFQDAIRETYPLFEENRDISINIPEELKSQLPREMINFLPSQGVKQNYQFSSEDGLWKINLTRTYLSLSNYRYYSWEEFINYLIPSFEALIEIYSPTFFTRIGLRYKDLIDKYQLNLGELSWDELLQPQIGGILSDPDIKQNVIGTNNTTEIRLSDGESNVRIHHGLVNAKGHDDVCYMIDSDFFTEYKASIDQARNKLDYFNQRGARLLRWCITDTLHNAFGPESR